MATLTYRNRRGELVDIRAVPATRFKTEFGAILDDVAAHGAVTVTRHDTPKAVLLSYAEFESLVKARTPTLGHLTEQFDGMLERMQASKAKKGMAAAFNAAPVGLGRAAVRMTQKTIVQTAVTRKAAATKKR